MKTLVSVLALCGVMACAASDITGSTIHTHATVQWNPIEGGFFELQADDGENYDPINLPGCFAEAGLRVEVTLVPRNYVSVHMAGPIVEIKSITSPGRICALSRPR
jgi:hypothetical protein